MNKNERIFILSNFLIICFVAFSFTQAKVWLDEDLNETTEKNGVYYRPNPEKKRSGYFIIDYYKNGNKFRDGKAKSTKVKNENFYGFVNYYYQNGKLSKIEKYKDGKLDGDYVEYYESGQVRVMGSYENGKEEGVWKIFNKSGKIKNKGKYRDGEKVGVWKTYYKNVYYPDNE